MKLSSALTVFGLLATLTAHAAAPPNDNFTNRIVMVGSSLTVTGFNTGASREPGETRLFGTGAQTVWWTWVATKDVRVKLTTLGSVQTLDTTLGVFTGSVVSNLTTIASDDDTGANGGKSLLFFNATNGGNYHFQVDGFVPNDVGKVFLNLHESNTPPAVLITNILSGSAFPAGSAISVFAFASDYGTVTNVEFYQDSTRLGQDTTSPYSITWSNGPLGNFALTAVAKNNSGLSTTSAPVNITINPNQLPTVSLSAPANNATFTAPVNVTMGASASDSDGSVTRVEFFQGTTLLGQDTSNPYSFTWTNVAAGNYTLTAVATDNSGGTNSSALINIVVNPNIPPSVSISSPANNTEFPGGSNVTISATASDTGGGSVTKVEFYQNASLLGQDTSNPYSLTWTNPAPGSYALTAVATDNGGLTATSAPVNIVINNSAPPVVTIRSPSANAVFVEGLNLNLLVIASDPDGTVAKVEYYQGAIKIGQSTTSPFSLVWSNVPAGSYSIAAVGTDNTGRTGTSAPVSITITALAANEVNVVPAESVWKYLDDGSNQGTAWQGIGFNDAAWASGAAQLGYGDGDEVTTNSFGADANNKFFTTYYRRAFTLTNAARFTNLIVQIIRDDGGVVYLNGTEVFRTSMPGGAIGYTTPASVNAQPLDETITFYATNVPPGLLVNGTNVLAVEIHQTVVTSSDISFDLELVGALGPATNFPPTVSITSPANNTAFYDPVNITINAIAADSDGSVTKVEFFQDGIKLGEDSTSPYSLTWSNAPAGSYILTAVATDNGTNSTTSAAVAITVNPNLPPVVSLTSPANNSSFVVPANVTLNATASDSGGTIAKVEFFEGGSKLGEDGTSPYSLVWTSPAPGIYQLTARATDNGGLISTSAVVNVSVVSNTPPIVSLTSPANNATFFVPTNITLTATASDDVGVTNVEFFQGSTKLGQDPTSPYSFTWANVAVGTYLLTARAADTSGLITTSAVVNITVVSNSRPLVSITNPVNNATFAAPANITIGVAASDSDGTVSRVEFFQGGTKLGTNLSAPYGLTWSNVAAGAYTLTAVATDNNGASSTSAPVAITVNSIGSISVWTAFNDHSPGTNTHVNATTWNIHGTSPGATGLLKSIATGTNTPVTLALTTSGAVAYGSTTEVPAPNTPMYTNFYNTVYFGSGTESAVQVPAGASVTYTFTGLDSSRRYTFKGGAVRGGLASNYTNRWTTVTLTGADAFTSAHTVNGVTSAQAPVDLLPNQAAFNFGANHTSTTGDMAVWENIDPGTDGTIVISCTQYSGLVPGGSSTANAPPYGYAVTGFSLEEISGNSFPLVSITSPTNNQFIVGPANITINADASDTGGSVIKVEFYQGTTKLGEDATNPYSLTWSNVVPGSYALRAVATDNSGLTSTSAVVNVTVITNTPPVVSITAPTNNQSFIAPANLTITADASDFAGTVTKVEFYQGATKLGEDTTSPFSFTWNSVGAGSYALTAVATDNSSATSTSAVVNITVISNSPPVVSITSPTNNSAFPASPNITITVNASDDGSIGKVEFYSDGIKLGEDLTNPYSFAWLSAPSGQHALTAVATDNLNSTATSAVVNITIVGNQPPSVSITNPPNNALLNAPTNLTISATASDSDGSVSLVEFYAGTTRLGQTATGSPYNFIWTNSLLGTYTLTAVATDNGGLAKTSAPVSVTFVGSGPMTLVSTGAVWKYLDNGTDQGTNWINLGFNDASWASGPAQLGYSSAPAELDEATTLNFGPDPNNKYNTYYFRHRFTVANPAAFSYLACRLLRDDGAVIYINGKEAFRSNMPLPPTVINYLTRAPASVGGAEESTFFPTNLPATLLVAGTNIVAVEVHQNSAASSDISFDFELIGNTGAISNPPPLVSITSPFTGSSFAAPADITISASASDSDGIAKVEFFQNTAKLGETTSSPYNLAWNAVPAGTYALNAVATDNFGNKSTSSVVNVSVVLSTAPTIAGVNPSPGTVGSLSQITVTFDQPVTGVNASDLLVNGVAPTSLTGSNATYEFTFPSPAEGIVSVTWATDHGIVNRLNPPVPFNAQASGAHWQYLLVDTSPPVVTGVSPMPGATVAAFTELTVTFNEPVGGVQAGDMLINGEPAKSVTGAGAGPYVFKFFEPVTNGPVQVTWTSTPGIHDFSAAANLFAGGAWTYTLNTGLVEADVVINEFMYHATPTMPEVAGLEWVELFNRGSNAISLLGWRLQKDVEFTFTNTTLPAGGYLVVSANVTTFNARYPSVANVIGNWQGSLGNHGGSMELVNPLGQKVDSVSYGTEGEWAVRERPPVASLGHFGWRWLAEADGLGKSMELRNPNLPDQHGQNWAASLTVNGTPGTPNSVLAADIAPLILDVLHQPIVPRSTNSVTITARIVDELPTVATVKLFYRVDANPQNAFSSTNMFDDGTHGDGSAGDNVFAATLAPRANNTIMEFYVEATDLTGHTRTWPAPARQTGGALGQFANCLYQVDDSSYTNSQPLYRIIMTEIERAELAQIWSSAADSNAEMNGTFITSDGTGTEIRYRSAIRNRGHGTRTASIHNIRVGVPDDNKWHSVRALNLNTQFTQDQVAGPQVMQKSGLAMSDARAVRARVNNQDLTAGNPNSEPTFGCYAHNENLSSEWTSRHFPNDAGGNIYRGIRSDSSGEHANLSYKGEVQSSYTNVYFKETNVSDDDWTDLIELTRVLNNTPDAQYVAEVSRVADVDNWMLYFAANTLLDNSETALSNGTGDDYAMYRPSVDRRFKLLPYDVDSIFGQGQTVGSTTASLFKMNAEPPINKFINFPDLLPRYFAALKHLMDTSFSAQEINPLLDRTLGTFVPQATINSMKSWQASRNTYVLSQMPLNLTITTTFPIVNGYNQASAQTVALAGLSSVVSTRYVKVNGNLASWTGTTGNWSANVTLHQGTNNVLVQTIGLNGQEVARTSMVIWYDDTTVQTVSGAIAADTTWTAASGPYQITGNLTINSGATLTILPGTTVYLNSGVTVTVANGGRLLAEGTATDPILFTRPAGSSTSWSGITVNGGAGSPETRIAYARFEFNAATAIHSSGGTLFLDHLSFGNPAVQYVSLDSSSFVVSECVFPSLTAAVEPVHGTGGIKAGGRGLFLRNFFGSTLGYSDVVDFTGGNRPGGPIVQFINNVFTGSSDDILDLDGTDAWVEGNIFLHAHKNGSPDTASAVSGGNDSGQTSEVTVIGNLFYDCDQAATAKQGNFYTFINNTVVHQTRVGGTDTEGAVLNFADDGIPQALGMYVEGNIIFDAENLVRYLTNGSAVFNNTTFTNNLMPFGWSGPGGGNTSGNPLFAHVPTLSETTNFTSWAQAQVVRQWFSLLPGSPASGLGPNGHDQGGAVPLGVSISGEPMGSTNVTTAILRVGLNRGGNGIPASGFPNGSGFTHYKWRLDSGVWSAETPIATSITLSGLGSGIHQVEVVGKNDAGTYQDDPAYRADAVVTFSRTWSVQTNRLRVVINELLARNDSAVPVGSKYPDLIELYNPDSGAVDLGGMGITDEKDTPLKFIFPPNTMLGGGQYLVLYGDNDNSPPGIHVGFSLNQSGDDLYLYSSAGELFDSITFGLQAPNLSIGRLSDGSWALTQPTFGLANIAQALGNQLTLKINEWLSDGTTPYADDFLELYNPTTLPVKLGGLYLTDQLPGAPNLDQIAALSFIPASGFAVFIADANPDSGATHLNFKLSPDQGFIGLYTANLSPIDCVVYGPQITDVSQGRSPNGSTNYAFFGTATPGSPNPAPTGTGGQVMINEVFANNINIEESDGTAPDWVEIYNPSTNTVDLSDMSLSDTAANARRWVFPPGSSVTGLGYLLIRFDSSTALSATNTGFGLKSTGGSVYLYDKLSNGGSLLSSITFGIQAVDFSIGRYPNGSTNWVLLSPSPRTVNSVPPVLGFQSNLKVNEWMAYPASGEDWFEIFNSNVNLPVAIGGLHLTDDSTKAKKYQIPALSYIGVGLYAYQRFWADNPNTPSPDHTNFKLNDNGEYIAITTPLGATIDSITFGQQSSGVSQGRLPDGATTIVNFPTTATPGDANFLPLQNIVINEVLTHSEDPLEDAIELRNTGSDPVNISGWYLSDAKHYLTKFKIPNGTVIAGNGFRVFYENQFNPILNDLASFALDSAKGDQVYLSAADTNGVLTGYRAEVKFDAAALGVSIGRYQTSVGVDFVALSERTFGADNPDTLAQFRGGSGLPNGYPLVGPVVISEIMYHPPDNGTNDNVLDEFIELHNISSNIVPLYHSIFPTNVWRLRNAVKYDFPTNLSLLANGYLLVVSFDPVTNSAALAAFRMKYGVSSSVPIYGPYEGKLDNGSDKVELYKSDTPLVAPDPDAGYVPSILVDRVRYADATPWPVAADGSGSSLHRLRGNEYGNDPVNWIAAAPTPGGPQNSDADGDGLPDAWEIAHNLDPNDATGNNGANGDPDHDGMTNLQEYLAGTDPQSAASVLELKVLSVNPAVLRFTARPDKSYSIEYCNALGTAWSELIHINPDPVGQVWDVTDASTNTMRFYRLRTP